METGTNDKRGTEVYIEFTAAHDAFCVLRDNTCGDFVKGRFHTIQEAKDWAVSNGYVVNEYVDGKLQPKQ